MGLVIIIETSGRVGVKAEETAEIEGGLEDRRVEFAFEADVNAESVSVAGTLDCPLRDALKRP